jgi:hypothetical protein
MQNMVCYNYIEGKQPIARCVVVAFTTLPFWGRNGPSLSGDLLLSMSDKRLIWVAKGNLTISLLAYQLATRLICYIIVFMKDEIFPINRDIDDHIDEFEAIGIC